MGLAYSWHPSQRAFASNLHGLVHAPPISGWAMALIPFVTSPSSYLDDVGRHIDTQKIAEETNQILTEIQSDDEPSDPNGSKGTCQWSLDLLNA
jgi:hypothetical protein